MGQASDRAQDGQIISVASGKARKTCSFFLKGFEGFFFFFSNAFYKNFAIHLAITKFLNPWKSFLTVDGPC